MHSRSFSTSCCLVLLCLFLCSSASVAAREYHVSVNGDDTNDGSSTAMLKTISAAARLAQPGDTITVHEGVYRERITPPRGGESDDARIVYRAAPGEKVEIKGSEIVTGWEKVEHDTWKVVLPNSFFGGYNPFNDPIHGDWFNPKGRKHHTAAVYLDGHWLIEAAELEEVLAPAGTTPPWLHQAGQDYLLNVAWLQPENAPGKVAATAFTAKKGTQNAPCDEGGDCIGFILHGHWVKYEGVEFAENTAHIDIRAASASHGGIIEVRLDGPEGKLLGSCKVPNTGGWQSWKTFKTAIEPLSGVNTLCLVFKGFKAAALTDDLQLWYAQADDQETTLWAQFKGVNPNERLVEVNVRRAVFYPDKPFVNYITVRGFSMMHAATQWAPPTAEQIGLIGTHWSKGWIIEDNDISYSVCTGVTLGKYGDEFDNTSADTAEGYVLTIDRALANGWNKDTIGGHVVRNNTISHCEQAGMVGSMGAIFSTVTGNTIHDIHVRQLFTGAEMAGIKFHGAIDTVIAQNHIYRCNMGVWLDWMSQGTLVSRNLFHDNPGQDLFVEVNHGPFVVENNIFLSNRAILSMSRGGAYAHNLIAGNILVLHYDSRMTPYHKPHSTELAGMHDNPRGDDRYYNNIFVQTQGLSEFNDEAVPVTMQDNVYLKGAVPAKLDTGPMLKDGYDPDIVLMEKEDGIYLEANFDAAWATAQNRQLVTTERLGITKVAHLPFEQRNGAPLCLSKDYFGQPRNEANPFPGPFEITASGSQSFRVWPVSMVDDPAYTPPIP